MKRCILGMGIRLSAPPRLQLVGDQDVFKSRGLARRRCPQLSLGNAQYPCSLAARPSVGKSRAFHVVLLVLRADTYRASGLGRRPLVQTGVKRWAFVWVGCQLALYANVR